MILLDTNVLVYATDARAPQHEASRRAVDAVIRGRVPGAVVVQVLVEYLAAVTSPSVRAPLRVEEALAQVTTFRRQIRTFDPPPSALEHLALVVAATGRAGRRTFDAYLAAQALALRIPTICTYNRADFAGINGLSVVLPEDVDM